MIAAWMLHAVVVGCLLSAGALAAEHLLRAHRRPARGVWVAVIVASLVWPTALWIVANRPAAPLPTLPEAPPTAVVSALGAPTAAPEAALLRVAPNSALRGFDGPILRVWGATSAALALFFLVLVARTHRLRRGWRTAQMAGRDVLVSEQWGPAVVGFIRPRVVLPGWCEGLAPDTLDFVLAHEEEHLRAGDLRLLLTAGLLPVIVPWHLPLWWQLSRLRTAVEADCDLRVLRRSPGRTRPYIELLLSMGQRAVAPAPLAALLSEPYATLQRRIRIMTMPDPKRPWISGSLLTGAALLLGALACSAPPPTDAGPDTAAPANPTGAEAASNPRSQTPGTDGAYPVFTPYSVAPSLSEPAEVIATLQRRYAALSDAADGRADVWYFVNEDGRVEDRRLDRSSGSSELDEIAMEAAAEMRFTPALNRDRKTSVWVSLPVVFGRGDTRPSNNSGGAPGPAPTVISSPALDGTLPEGATGVVTGVVRDVASGSPLPFSQVYLPETRRGALSDAEGRFRIEGVPAGSHQVVVDLVGYRVSEVQVNVGPRGATEVEFPLQAAVIELQPLVVAGR